MKPASYTPDDAGTHRSPLAVRRLRQQFLLLGVLSLAGLGLLPAATLAFERVTGNSPRDASPNFSMEVTDLGGGMAVFRIDQGSLFDGFINSIWFEDTADTLGTITFAPAFSDPGIFMRGPSNPANPPALSPFVSDTSFDADPPGSKKGILSGQSGAFVGSYNGSFQDVERALADGTIRVALHIQGIQGSGGSTYASVALPEPSAMILLCLAGLTLFRRARR